MHPAFKVVAGGAEVAQFLRAQGDGAQASADLVQLFRRVAFNVAIGNRDDHLRNHGFILGAQGWRLAPAFDMNPDADKADHVLNIDDTDNRPDLETVLATAPFYGLDAARALATEIVCVLRYRRLLSMFAPSPHDVWDRYLDHYGLEGVFPVADTEIGRLAAIASEEILYPEIARALAFRGAEVFVHSSSEIGSPLGTAKDVAKRARAWENMAYVVSANTAGASAPVELGQITLATTTLLWGIFGNLRLIVFAWAAAALGRFTAPGAARPRWLAWGIAGLGGLLLAAGLALLWPGTPLDLEVPPLPTPEQSAQLLPLADTAPTHAGRERRNELRRERA